MISKELSSELVGGGSLIWVKYQVTFVFEVSPEFLALLRMNKDRLFRKRLANEGLSKHFMTELTYK